MDWKKLIQDILSAGMTESHLGEKLGKSQAWVNAAKSGSYSDLKWCDGEALRKLHRRITKSLKSERSKSV